MFNHHMFSAGGPITEKYARPDEDLLTGSWTATPLWQKLDEETASDADYVTADINSAGDSFQVGLTSVSDPGIHSGHVVRLRCRVEQVTGVIWSATVRVYDGATLVSTDSITVTTSWTTHAFTLSIAEVSSITDYGNLRVTFEVSNDAEFTTYYCDVSWIEFEIP